MGKIETKLALGTVQFGLDYGITNTTGRVQEGEVDKILQTCKQYNISILDTAQLYGNSEEVLGRCLRKWSTGFQIISKLPICKAAEVECLFNQSLAKLGVNQLYGYIIHNFECFQKDKSVYNKLRELKEKGTVAKIGFSLYYPEQLDELFNLGIQPDLVQLPYNVLDQRFATVLPELKRSGVEVHVRSAFLQGLLLKNPDDVSAQFIALKPKLKRLNELADSCKVKLSHLLLAFVHLNENISNIVIGVTSKKELLENIAYINTIAIVKEVLFELSTLAEEDENLILPINWK